MSYLLDLKEKGGLNSSHGWQITKEGMVLYGGSWPLYRYLLYIRLCKKYYNEWDYFISKIIFPIYDLYGVLKWLVLVEIP